MSKVFIWQSRVDSTKRIAFAVVLLGLLVLASQIPASLASPQSDADVPITPTPTGLQRNGDWTPTEENFNGVTMVLVPAGCFQMGNDPEAYYYNASGDWVRGVPDGGQQCFTEPFWIDKYEVTQADFARLGGQKEEENGFSGENRPVERITWFEARDFCAARGMRLPTEAEWEYAAGGVESWVYPWGDEWDQAKVIGYRSSSEGTAEVGSLPEGMSWVGAMDLSGNVWEWVSSLYQAYPYTSAAEGNEDSTDVLRVLRGGSWYGDNAEYFRVAGRNWYSPLSWNYGWGFRCARSRS